MYCSVKRAGQSLTPLPAYPGGLLLERYWLPLQMGNSRKTHVEERNDMLLGREAKPLFHVGIRGGVTCSPHAGQSHFFGGQQHVLYGGGCGLDVFDHQHLWQSGWFGHHYNDDRRAEQFIALFI